MERSAILERNSDHHIKLITNVLYRQETPSIMQSETDISTFLQDLCQDPGLAILGEDPVRLFDTCFYHGMYLASLPATLRRLEEEPHSLQARPEQVARVTDRQLTALLYEQSDKTGKAKLLLPQEAASYLEDSLFAHLADQLNHHPKNRIYKGGHVLPSGDICPRNHGAIHTAEAFVDVVAQELIRYGRRMNTAGCATKCERQAYRERILPLHNTLLGILVSHLPQGSGCSGYEIRS